MRCCDLLTIGRKILLLYGLLLLLGTLPVCAQNSMASARLQAFASDTAAAPHSMPSTPTTLEAALQDLFTRADVVFAGEVLSIEHTPAAVLVTWRIEDAVRGATAGGTYVLREWQGLWQGESDRYQKGERALIMLHAPSAAGFGSPVGGGDGVIALRGEGANRTLDLRLLAQRVQVTDAARLRPAATLRAAGGSLAVSNALQRGQAARSGAKRLRLGQDGSVYSFQRAPEANGGVDAVQSPAGLGIEPAASATRELNSNVDGAVVLSMLHAWQHAGAVR